MEDGEVADDSQQKQQLQLLWSKFLLTLLKLRQHQVDSSEPSTNALNKAYAKISKHNGMWNEKVAGKCRKLYVNALEHNRKEAEMLKELQARIKNLIALKSSS